LAQTHPSLWYELLLTLLPRSEAPVDLMYDIIEFSLPVKEQEARFVAATGKSRRTFYNYKKHLGMTRSYQSRGSK